MANINESQPLFISHRLCREVFIHHSTITGCGVRTHFIDGAKKFLVSKVLNGFIDLLSEKFGKVIIGAKLKKTGTALSSHLHLRLAGSGFGNINKYLYR